MLWARGTHDVGVRFVVELNVGNRGPPLKRSRRIDGVRTQRTIALPIR